jgi:hypothetical protein
LEAGYKRPNKNYVDASVANGILARYYLLANKWQEAANAASKARQGYTLMPANASGLYDGFVTVNNQEWMWGFAHTTETQTTYASFFSMISNIAPGYAGIGYAPRLIDARLYEQIPDADLRKAWFNGPEGAEQATDAASLPYASVKFGHVDDWTDNYMYMRAAEMVLIEAEAYAHMGDGAKAAQALKVLMDVRQPGWNRASVTVDDIHLQRRIELWGEAGRVYDIRRYKQGFRRTEAQGWPAAALLAGRPTENPENWMWVLTIPQAEFDGNVNMDGAKDQNPTADE